MLSCSVEHQLDSMDMKRVAKGKKEPPFKSDGRATEPKMGTGRL